VISEVVELSPREQRWLFVVNCWAFGIVADSDRLHVPNLPWQSLIANGDADLFQFRADRRQTVSYLLANTVIKIRSGQILVNSGSCPNIQIF
jgi:hypothetical protein